MAESAITDLKVELEGIKQNLNTVDTITSRLDNAIVQLTTVATDVKSMLAVHEEKLHRAEKVDDLIFQKFRDKQNLYRFKKRRRSARTKNNE